MCEEVEEETHRTIPELEHCRLVQPCKDRIYVLVDGSIDINSLLLVQLHDRGSSVPVVGKRRGGWSLVSDIFLKKKQKRLFGRRLWGIAQDLTAWLQSQLETPCALSSTRPSFCC